MHRTTARLITIVAIAAGLLLAGCAGSDSDGGGDGGGATAGEAPPGGQPAGPGADEDAAGEGTGTGAPGTPQGRVQVRTRSVIYTAEMRVEVEDVDQAVRRTEALVSGADGLVASEDRQATEVANEDGTTTRKIASASMVVRVPPAAFTRILNGLSEFGTVVQQNRSARDVTEEVVDVASRVKSQQASVARIRTLMDDARTLNDIVLLEAELTRRQAELESLLARQATLAEQTDLATITVTFTLPEVGPSPEEEPELGFLSGLRNGWDALVTTVAVTLTVVGALLPFAVLAAVIGIPLLVVARRGRRTPRPPGAPGTAGAAIAAAARPESVE